MVEPTDILVLHVVPEYFPKFKSTNPSVIVLCEEYMYANLDAIPPTTTKVGWLCEPRSIHPRLYDNLAKVIPKLDILLTHHESICAIYPKAVYMPWGTTWIKPPDRAIHPKVWSIPTTIFSGKQITPMHLVRNRVAEWIHSTHHIPVYGKAAIHLDDKITLYRDAPFHVIVENSSAAGYFTEKIMDCFLTGTIPIYFGCCTIGKYFNADGIIMFNSLEQLANIMNTVIAEGMEGYNRRLDAVRDNYNRATKYIDQDQMLIDTLTPIIAKFTRVQSTPPHPIP